MRFLVAIDGGELQQPRTREDGPRLWGCGDELVSLWLTSGVAAARSRLSASARVGELNGRERVRMLKRGRGAESFHESFAFTLDLVLGVDSGQEVVQVEDFERRALTLGVGVGTGTLVTSVRGRGRGSLLGLSDNLNVVVRRGCIVEQSLQAGVEGALLLGGEGQREIREWVLFDEAREAREVMDLSGHGSCTSRPSKADRSEAPRRALAQHPKGSVARVEVPRDQKSGVQAQDR